MANNQEDILAKYGVQAEAAPAAPEATGQEAILAKYGATPAAPKQEEPAPAPVVDGPTMGAAPEGSGYLGNANPIPREAQKAFDAAGVNKNFKEAPFEVKAEMIAKKAASENWTFQAAQKVAEKVTGISAKEAGIGQGDAGLVDLGFTGNNLLGVANFTLDPLAKGIITPVGKLAAKPLEGAAAKYLADKTFAKNAGEVFGDMFDSAYSAAARKYFVNRVARSGLIGAGEMGVYGLGTAGMAQASEGYFDPAELAERTASSALFGGLFSAGGSVLGQALGRAEFNTDVAKAAEEGALQRAETLQAKIDAPTGIENKLEAKKALLETQIANRVPSPKQEAKLAELDQKIIANQKEKANFLPDFMLEEASLAKAKALETEHQSLLSLRSALKEGSSPVLEKRLAVVNQELERTRFEMRELVHNNQRITVQNKLKAGYQRREAFLNEAQQLADSTAKRLVSRKIIAEGDEGIVGQSIFLDMLRKKGVQVDGASQPSKLVQLFSQMTERLNYFDKKYGTGLVKTFVNMNRANTLIENAQIDEVKPALDLIRSLEKQGLDRHEITRLMLYVEGDGAGNVRFNPLAINSEKLVRPAYNGPDPLLKFPQLANLRQEWDRLYRDAGGGAYVPGYQPIKAKRGPGLQRSGDVSKISDPSFKKERTIGLIDPTVHETDQLKLFSDYARQAVRQKYLEPLIPQIKSDIQKMVWLGDEAGIQAYQESVARALGLDLKNTPKALSEMFTKQFYKANEAALNEVIKTVAPEAPPNLLDEVLRSVQNYTYRSLVLVNPKAQIKQWLQPEAMGPAEITTKYTALGERLFRTKEGRAFADKHRKELMAPEPGMLEDMGISKPFTNKVVGAVDKVGEVLTKPFEKNYSRLERNNREKIFLGGHAQFKNALEKGPDSVNAVLDGLLDGQKNAVLSALEKEGPEAAAIKYASIRTLRTNFIFSMLDRPEAFLKGGLRYVPFTSWTTNTIARYATDIKGIGKGGGSQLAKRIAVPFLMTELVRGILNSDIDFSTYGDLGRVADMALFPAISQPIAATTKAFNQGAPIGEAAGEGFSKAADFVPYVRPVRTFNKLRDEGNDTARSILGIRRADLLDEKQEGLVKQAVRNILGR